MYNYCGQVYTISKVCENETYKLANENGGGWSFIDDWLEECEETPCYVSSFTDEPQKPKEKNL